MTAPKRRAWVTVPSVVGHQRGATITLSFEDGSHGVGRVLKVDASKRRIQVELFEARPTP